MINWTEEDVKFICENLINPTIAEIAKTFESYDKSNEESLKLVIDAVTKQIREIKYEQERDRRFYRAMFSDVLVRNTLFTPSGYDDFYKKWCEEFDKLNKEKFI